MEPTSYPIVNELTTCLLGEIQKVLKEKLVGLYLFGSATAGDFDPPISDIDLLAAIKEDLTNQEFKDLEKMHQEFSLRFPSWKDRIEVAYLSVFGLQSFKNQKSKIAVISPGEPFHIKEAGDDWLINWYAVQQNGTVIFGPDQASLITPISRDDFIAFVKKYAPDWRERIKGFTDQSSPGSLAYAVFTLCRALYGYRKGEQVSKKQAAAWAATEFPQWSALIDRAAAWRKTQWEEEQQSAAPYLPEVIEFVNFAIDIIEGK